MKYGEDPIQNLNDEKLEKFFGMLADAEPGERCMNRLNALASRDSQANRPSKSFKNLWMAMTLLAACALAGVLYYTFWNGENSATPQTAPHETQKPSPAGETVEEIGRRLLGELNRALATRDSGALARVIAPSFWEECTFTLANLPPVFFGEDFEPIRTETQLFARLDALLKEEVIGDAFASFSVDFVAIRAVARARAVMSCEYMDPGLRQKVPLVLYVVREQGNWSLTAGVGLSMLLLAVQDQVCTSSMGGNSPVVDDQMVESPK